MTASKPELYTGWSENNDFRTVTWLRHGRSRISVQCIRAISLGVRGVKRPGRDVHALPSSAEVKNEWSYTSASPVCVRGVDKDFNFLGFYLITLPVPQIIVSANRLLYDE
jgi:hypothetical protein